ncbi:ABC transporter ATP-binding protein [Desulfonatronovibrio hydrogenovorans]|uniref:ABC transporter ATP-binding protein n=1 Tax=Desulfonatronovibrio hydrogenovorans TaxID=53245 RepID=UPI00049041A4|nr:ABC transporter ATP-binding protein [Desulfonatronovibrio hydrogenovorans]
MNPLILKTKDLYKEYLTDKKRVIKALSGISLEVHSNDFLCILGPSGCGKSTLLRIFAGLEESSGGTISYKNKPLTSSTHEIGMVFQEYSLLPWRTVIGNVSLGLEFLGRKKSERIDSALKYLRLVGLEDYAHSYPYELSGGMQQRVAIARSLANDPEILLMDEPFGALDAHTRILLQKELLRIWNKNRKTVLFVTHSVDEAIYLADRILVMSAGPGQILEEITVDMERPRKRSDPEYGHLTTRILEMLDSQIKQ